MNEHTDRPRARRILETNGFDALLREVTFLDTNAARRIYLEEAASIEGLTEEQGGEIVRAAGREMTSSSRLRSVLTYLAEEMPEAYKDVASVVEIMHQSGISNKVVRLKPVGVIKG